MKEIFEETLNKQVDRIVEVMRFKSPTQEKTIRTALFANLKRSIGRQRMAGKVVLDAREARIYKFANALRISKSETELKENVKKAFPDKYEHFYQELILRYNKVFLGAIQYNFPLQTFKTAEEKKQEKLEKKSVDELQDMAIRTLTERVSRLEKQLEKLKDAFSHNSRILVNHRHDSTGQAVRFSPLKLEDVPW